MGNFGSLAPRLFRCGYVVAGPTVAHAMSVPNLADTTSNTPSQYRTRRIPHCVFRMASQSQSGYAPSVPATARTTWRLPHFQLLPHTNTLCSYRTRRIQHGVYRKHMYWTRRIPHSVTVAVEVDTQQLLRSSWNHHTQSQYRTSRDALTELCPYTDCSIILN
eukprot:894002-Rhodomonas_salina.1